jgi:hypothetical protein
MELDLSKNVSVDLVSCVVKPKIGINNRSTLSNVQMPVQVVRTRECLNLNLNNLNTFIHLPFTAWYISDLHFVILSNSSVLFLAEENLFSNNNEI